MYIKIESYKDSQGRQMYKTTVDNTTYHKSSIKSLILAVKNHKPENEKLTTAIAKNLKS